MRRLLGFRWLVLCGCTGPDGRPTDASVDDSRTDASDATVRIRDAGTDVFVPGIVLWLEGNAGLNHAGNLVTDWIDQSPEKNNASASEGGPDYVTASINGLPGVHFQRLSDGGVEPALHVQPSPSLSWGTGDFLLEVVAKFSNDYDKNQGCLYRGANDVGMGPTLIAGVPYTGPMFKVDAGLTGTLGTVTLIWSAQYNDGLARVYGMRRVAATFELRANGKSLGSVPNDVSDLAQQLGIYIGHPGTSMSGRPCGLLDGEIAEVIAVAGPAADTHVDVVESYLMKKYGL